MDMHICMNMCVCVCVCGLDNHTHTDMCQAEISCLWNLSFSD